MFHTHTYTHTETQKKNVIELNHQMDGKSTEQTKSNEEWDNF